MAEIATLGLKVESTPVDDATESLNKFSASAEKAEKSSEQLGKASEKAGKQAKDSSDKAKVSVDDLSKAFSGVSKSVLDAAKQMLVFAGATIGISAFISTLSKFEQSMASVAAVTRASADEMKAMRDIAKELGATTEFSASQAADALTFLGMAGFSAKQSIAALPAVLDLATASVMGLDSAADIASNVMSGFGIEASKASNVADVLSAASSRANTNVMQLGQAMSTVAPVARSLGIGLEDTSAAIGVLSDAGIQSGRAGTSLRGVLAALSKPTKEAQRALAGLGLTAKDVNPRTNELADVLDKLGAAGLNTSDAMTIFGREAASGALVLIDSSKRVRELGAELRNVEGEAKLMAEIMRDNLKGDLLGVVSAVEGVIIALGEAGLTAILRFVAQSLTTVLRAISGFVDGLSSIASAVSSFLKPAFDAVKQYSDIAIAALAGFYSPAVIAGFVVLTNAVRTLAVSLAVGLVNSIRAVTLAMLANPLGLLVAAISVTLVALYKFNDSFRELIGDDLPAFARSAANKIIGSFVGAYELITAYWSNFPTVFGAVGIGAVNLYIQYINKMVSLAKEAINEVIALANSVPFVDINRIDAQAPTFGLLTNKYEESAKDAASKAIEAAKEAFNRDWLGGVLPEMKSEISEISNLIDDLDDTSPDRPDGGKASDLAKMIEQLKIQKATLGMTAEQAERYNIEIAKGSQAERQMALALFDSVKAWEAQEKAMQFAIDSGRQYLAFEREMEVFRERSELSVAAIGMGNKARELAEAELNIRQEYANKRLELEQAQLVASTALEQKQFEDRLAMLDVFEQQKLLTTQQAAEARAEAEGNWINGLTSAWENFAEKAQDIAGQVDSLFTGLLDTMTSSFGNAFEAMIFDSENFGESMRKMGETMLRSIVNALGQMAAQWLAYQAVQLLVGKTTQLAGSSAVSANASASAIQAGINAYSATAAIPVIGPALAPAAMASALAVTVPMAAAVKTVSLAGMAHDGIDSIPQTGTWLLEKGERVTTADTSARMDSVLERIDSGMRANRGYSPDSGGDQGKVIVNVTNAPEGTRIDQRIVDRDTIIDVMIEDLKTDGEYSQAGRQLMGWQRQGT